MTEKEMRRLSRADLLEMLIEQSAQLEELKDKLAEAEEALQERTLIMNKAGSIAEASLRLNGIFEAAQAASEQYMQSIKKLSERQEAVCAQMERESREKSQRMLAETERRCRAMELDTKARCSEIVSKVKSDLTAYWDTFSGSLGSGYEKGKESEAFRARLDEDPDQEK